MPFKDKVKRDLYYVWYGMILRCYDKNRDSYKNYGGRGIIIYRQWKESFEFFYEWSINNGYKKGLSLDRIDNNGNYEPNNCRWATEKEQANNKRTNHLLTFNGKTQTIMQWSRELNINETTIHERLKRNWSIEKILTTSGRNKK